MRSTARDRPGKSRLRDGLSARDGDVVADLEVRDLEALVHERSSRPLEPFEPADGGFPSGGPVQVHLRHAVGVAANLGAREPRLLVLDRLSNRRRAAIRRRKAGARSGEEKNGGRDPRRAGLHPAIIHEDRDPLNLDLRPSAKRLRAVRGEPEAAGEPDRRGNQNVEPVRERRTNQLMVAFEQRKQKRISRVLPRGDVHGHTAGDLRVEERREARRFGAKGSGFVRRDRGLAPTGMPLLGSGERHQPHPRVACRVILERRPGQAERHDIGETPRQKAGADVAKDELLPPDRPRPEPGAPLRHDSPEAGGGEKRPEDARGRTRPKRGPGREDREAGLGEHFESSRQPDRAIGEVRRGLEKKKAEEEERAREGQKPLARQIFVRAPPPRRSPCEKHDDEKRGEDLARRKLGTASCRPSADTACANRAAKSASTRGSAPSAERRPRFRGCSPRRREGAAGPPEPRRAPSRSPPEGSRRRARVPARPWRRAARRAPPRGPRPFHKSGLTPRRPRRRPRARQMFSVRARLRRGRAPTPGERRARRAGRTASRPSTDRSGRSRTRRAAPRRPPRPIRRLAARRRQGTRARPFRKGATPSSGRPARLRRAPPRSSFRRNTAGDAPPRERRRGSPPRSFEPDSRSGIHRTRGTCRGSRRGAGEARARRCRRRYRTRLPRSRHLLVAGAKLAAFWMASPSAVPDCGSAISGRSDNDARLLEGSFAVPATGASREERRFFRCDSRLHRHGPDREKIRPRSARGSMPQGGALRLLEGGTEDRHPSRSEPGRARNCRAPPGAQAGAVGERALSAARVSGFHPGSSAGTAP